MKINNKIITISIAILFLFVIFQTSITSKIITNQKSSVFFDGYISGKTEYTIDGKTYNLAYAKVKIENRLFKVTRSDSNGNYGLHVKAPYPDGYYNVSASSEKIIEKDGKYYELVPQTKLANVNFRSSWDIVNFVLNCKETKDKEKIKNAKIIEIPSSKDKTNNYGRIYGSTVRKYCWSWNPISNVLVTTGTQGKSTISDGSYSISGLPLNVPITIKARKIGYISDSKTVTLTEDDPEEYLVLDLQLFIKNSKEKNFDLLRNLLSSSFFSSDTRPDLLSTFSFVS